MSAYETKVKICGIKSPEMALKAGAAGAEYIGLVCHRPSKRYVEVQQAALISAEARSIDIKPVLVCVNHTAQDMLSLCQKTNVNMVQCHGNISRRQHRFLPEHIHRILAIEVDDEGQAHFELSQLRYLNARRDAILLDGAKPGSGHRFSLHRIPSALFTFRLFVAGGLNCQNVMSAVEQYRPYAVDVSSGIEGADGEKSSALIEEFVLRAKQQERIHV